MRFRNSLSLAAILVGSLLQGNLLAHSRLFVASGNTVTGYSISTGSLTAAWSRTLTFSPGGLSVVPNKFSAVLLVIGGGQTVGLNALTGAVLWTRNGGPVGRLDGYRQFYTNPLTFPHGAPKFGAKAPVIPLMSWSVPNTTYLVQLVDTSSGTVVCSFTLPAAQPMRDFFPTRTMAYDVLTGGNPATRYMRRISLTSCKPSDVWKQGPSSIWRNRNPMAISADINNDGIYDVVTRAYFSNAIYWLSGANGNIIRTTSYSSMDVLTMAAVQGTGGSRCDVIVAAQNSRNGGVSRYRASDGSMVWQCPSRYNNQTIIGIINRGACKQTVLSGWRNTKKLVAFDALTGSVLWENVPCVNHDGGATGVPDMTGDGNDDVLSAVTTTSLQLFDGVSGKLATWFKPISANSFASFAVWRNPALSADKYVLPMTQPWQSQTFYADAGTAHKGDIYFLLGSMSGTIPGIQLGNVCLPLNFDLFTIFSLGRPNPPFVNQVGVLDQNGHASGVLWRMFSGVPSSFRKVNLNHAYLLFDLKKGNPLDFASSAIPLNFF